MNDKQPERVIPPLAEIRQRAFDMKKATGGVLGHMHQAIAQHYGFKTYAALLAYKKERGEP